jgi:hypothetical protein
MPQEHDRRSGNGVRALEMRYSRSQLPHPFLSGLANQLCRLIGELALPKNRLLKCLCFSYGIALEKHGGQGRQGDGQETVVRSQSLPVNRRQTVCSLQSPVPSP